MAFLTDEQRKQIAAAIAEAEGRTSGELVAVIARAADHYLYIALLVPALLALLAPGIILMAWPGLAAAEVYSIQSAIFIVLALVLLIPPVRMWVVPKSVKHRRASRLAREQFIARGLHNTKDRTGVLVFVSVAEHYVEIIADAGIDAKVPPGAWDGMVADFVARVRARKVADGFLAVIQAAGGLLAEHFPRSAGDRDELPNRLIEI